MQVGATGSGWLHNTTLCYCLGHPSTRCAQLGTAAAGVHPDSSLSRHRRRRCDQPAWHHCAVGAWRLGGRGLAHKHAQHCKRHPAAPRRQLRHHSQPGGESAAAPAPAVGDSSVGQPQLAGSRAPVGTRLIAQACCASTHCADRRRVPLRRDVLDLAVGAQPLADRERAGARHRLLLPQAGPAVRGRAERHHPQQ
jgi:hypothetical protein